MHESLVIESDQATVPNVQEFFSSLFTELPAYQERYIGTVPQPVLSVSLSADGTSAFHGERP